MRFFADHDVYAKTVSHLRSQGYDVETARDAGLSSATDEAILAHCAESGRILVTRDKDFGSLVFVQGLPCPGLILIRTTPLLADRMHDQLTALIRGISPLEGAFIVVEPGRYRVRRVR